MLPEKWASVAGNIKDNFQVKDHGVLHCEDDGGTDIEFIEFEGPLGLMRLEFVSRPVVLDKKTKYSNRIGSETKIDYIYSDEEKNHMLIAYKWDETSADWIEVRDNSLFS